MQQLIARQAAEMLICRLDSEAGVAQQAAHSGARATISSLVQASHRVQGEQGLVSGARYQLSSTYSLPLGCDHCDAWILGVQTLCSEAGTRRRSRRLRKRLLQCTTRCR